MQVTFIKKNTDFKLKYIENRLNHAAVIYISKYFIFSLAHFIPLSESREKSQRRFFGKIKFQKVSTKIRPV